MNHASRRQFLAVSGAGAVAVGAAVVVPASLASAAQAPGDGFDSEFADGPLDANPVIVSVDDLKAGRLSVMHGEREFTVTDHELAQRLAHLARSEA